MQYTQDHSQFLCLDTLLTFVNYLSARLDQPTPAPTAESDAIDYEALNSAKASKRNLLEGAIRFNVKPKDGIAFLESKGLIYTSENAHLPRPTALAMFLKNNPRFDKKLLGDYISRPDNAETLTAFIGLFDFRDVSRNLSLTVGPRADCPSFMGLLNGAESHFGCNA